MNAAYEPTREFAERMDREDALRDFRERFHFPKVDDGSEAVYLCGHSLGLQPKSAAAYIQQELDDWARLGVEGHFRGRNPWMPYHRLLTEKMARIVGAQPHETVVMNSLTVNLHLMMVSFYRPMRERYKIIVEAGAFPSDQYAVKSQAAFHGFDPASAIVELRPREGESTLRDEDILETIDREGSSVAVVMLGAVNYSTGQAFDLAEIVRAGHRNGCIVGFDLAHAAGNLRLNMHDSGADFAVWCSYKYLNGGPGTTGGCFVHERHARASELPRFAGWWGHDESTRFRMGPDFQPIAGAEGWQLSNPPIFALAPLRASIDLFDEAGMEALRAKSVKLTAYLEYLLAQCASDRFEIITPREPHRRGAQLSLRIAERGREVCDRLASAGVICDYREPNIVRVAPTPLYNSYIDVWRFVQAFAAEVPARVTR